MWYMLLYIILLLYAAYRFYKSYIPTDIDLWGEEIE